METLVLMSPAFFFGGILGFAFLIVMFLVNRRLQLPILRIFEIIVLVFSIIMILIPTGILFLMRQEIKSARSDEYYVDTGIHAKATYDENNRCSFTFKDEEYKELVLDLTDCFEYVDNSHAGRGIAVFNLNEELNFLQKAIGISDDHVMYEAKNATGYTLYSDNDRLFYPVAHEKEILDFYTDFSNYTWQFVKTTGVQDPERTDLKLTKQDFKDIAALSDQNADTPIDLSDYLDSIVYTLTKTSPDGIYTGTIEVIKYEDDWYWVSELTDENAKEEENAFPLCQKLPKHLSSQFTE